MSPCRSTSPFSCQRSRPWGRGGEPSGSSLLCLNEPGGAASYNCLNIQVSVLSSGHLPAPSSSKGSKGVSAERLTTPATFSEQRQSPGESGSFEKGGSLAPGLLTLCDRCMDEATGELGAIVQSLLLLLLDQCSPLPRVLWETPVQRVFSRAGLPRESALGKLPAHTDTDTAIQDSGPQPATESACLSGNTHCHPPSLCPAR